MNMPVKIDDKDFMKKMNKFIDYSFGFIEGAEKGKKELMNKLGDKLIVVVGEYIDSSARTNPAQLHHVYEWDQVGDPSARLFDLDKIVSGSFLRITYNFTQSQSIKAGSTEPFFEKATVMEEGGPVIIAPRRKAVLRFEIDGEEIFTSKPVTVKNPGGVQTTRGFRMTINEFFRTFSQSILEASGIARDLRNLKVFVSRMGSGGKLVGRGVGYKWITNAGGTI